MNKSKSVHIIVCVVLKSLKSIILCTCTCSLVVYKLCVKSSTSNINFNSDNNNYFPLIESFFIIPTIYRSIYYIYDLALHKPVAYQNHSLNITLVSSHKAEVEFVFFVINIYLSFICCNKNINQSGFSQNNNQQ